MKVFAGGKQPGVRTTVQQLLRRPARVKLAIAAYRAKNQPDVVRYQLLDVIS